MIRKLLLLFIRFYQLAISPHLGRWCRFQPSCSEYTREALMIHGLWRGLWFGVCRMGRCHPFCKGGHDPVPDCRSGRLTAMDKEESPSAMAPTKLGIN